MIDLLPLVNKTVPLRFRGADLSLDLSHALFSSFGIDAGTKLLFKAIGRDEKLARAKRILDAGSGVGVIGLGVAAAFPDARIVARDRDLLAVAFSERNRRRNRISNVSIEQGLMGTGRSGGPWDYILSNIPAKAGAPVIAAFIGEAAASLSPGGRLGIVIVKPLVDELRGYLEVAGFSIVSEERGSMHRVFVAETGQAKESSLPRTVGAESAGAVSDPSAAPRYDLTAYRRRRGEFKLYGRSYQATGYWGLPDFDTIAYPHVIAAELLSRFASDKKEAEVLVLDPGIGHAVLWLALTLACANKRSISGPPFSAGHRGESRLPSRRRTPLAGCRYPEA
jgi:hypothetical protein